MQIIDAVPVQVMAEFLAISLNRNERPSDLLTQVIEQFIETCPERDVAVAVRWLFLQQPLVVEAPSARIFCAARR